MYLEILLFLQINSLVFADNRKHEYDEKYDYCQRKCGGDTNTICNRNKKAGGTECLVPLGDCEKMPMNDTFRKSMLDKHNELRQHLASGKDTRGSNAESSNMMVLNYDFECEYYALCWANTCSGFEHPHDKCRVSKDGTQFGQNMAMKAGIKFNDKEYVQSHVQMWYNEIEYTRPIDLEQFGKYKNRKSIGHFTALSWATTTHVGCALVKMKSKIDGYITYCNYKPTGNILGDPVYLKGKKCSKCPAGFSCGKKYDALCGETSDPKATRKKVKERVAQNKNFTIGEGVRVLDGGQNEKAGLIFTIAVVILAFLVK